jgi:cell division protease FtsH
MKKLTALFARPAVRIVSLLVLSVALLAAILVSNMDRLAVHSTAQQISASEAATIVKQGAARSLEVQGGRVFLKTEDGDFVFVKEPQASVPQMFSTLGVTAADLAPIEYRVDETSPVAWAEVFPTILVTLLLGAVLLIMLRRGGHGPGAAFGRSRARRFVGQTQRVTFEDVAGAAEAKEELSEIVDFLKAPQRFHAMGARIP